MSDSDSDLWPDDLFTRPSRSPRKLLAEQVDFLNKRAAPLIQASIAAEVPRSTDWKSFEFIIECTSIKRRAVLFHVEHRVAQVYPCNIHCIIWEPEFPSPDEDEDWRIASGESEFVMYLKEILNSGFVRSVVESMFAEASDQE